MITAWKNQAPVKRSLFSGGQLLTVALLGCLLAAGVVTATGMGYISIEWPTVATIIAAKLFRSGHWIADLDPLLPVVVWQVRLPRILASSLVGGSLAACGVVFQGLLLNPLADPYTLGISAGASFGASLAIVLSLSFLGNYSLTLFAFLGALATLIAVIYLSSSDEGYGSTSLILSGIIVAAILSAAISFLKYLADEQVGAIIFWLMGSFAGRTWSQVVLVTVFSIIGLAVFFFFSRDLNLMALGRRSAASLGVSTKTVTLTLLVTASLVTAACVSISGIIGFVGLLVPHIMRLIAGPDNRRLLPLSFLAGALLLLAADTLTRAILPREVPVGVLTALIGGPFFCYLFRKRQKKGVTSGL